MIQNRAVTFANKSTDHAGLLNQLEVKRFSRFLFMSSRQYFNQLLQVKHTIRAMVRIEIRLAIQTAFECSIWNSKISSAIVSMKCASERAIASDPSKFQSLQCMVLDPDGQANTIYQNPNFSPNCSDAKLDHSDSLLDTLPDQWFVFQSKTVVCSWTNWSHCVHCKAVHSLTAVHSPRERERDAGILLETLW